MIELEIVLRFRLAQIPRLILHNQVTANFRRRLQYKIGMPMHAAAKIAKFARKIIENSSTQLKSSESERLEGP